MTAQLIQEMDTPPKYKSPQDVVAGWMAYIRATERRWPTVRELSERSGVSRSRAGEYRRLYLRSHLDGIETARPKVGCEKRIQNG